MSGKEKPSDLCWRNKVTVCLNDSQFAKLCSLAEKERRSLSSQVRWILNCYLK